MTIMKHSFSQFKATVGACIWGKGGGGLITRRDFMLPDWWAYKKGVGAYKQDFAVFRKMVEHLCSHGNQGSISQFSKLCFCYFCYAAEDSVGWKISKMDGSDRTEDRGVTSSQQLLVRILSTTIRYLRDSFSKRIWGFRKPLLKSIIINEQKLLLRD